MVEKRHKKGTLKTELSQGKSVAQRYSKGVAYVQWHPPSVTSKPRHTIACVLGIQLRTGQKRILTNCTESPYPVDPVAKSVNSGDAPVHWHH